MRRHDREITDSARIAEVIQTCDCCRIGFREAEGAYILPLNFGYTQVNGGYVFYFHGAAQGRKAELARERPAVGFELDTGHALKKGEVACRYSFAYQSVIGKGIFETVLDEEERRKGLGLLMYHYTGREDWQFPEDALDGILVFKLTVTEMTCKEQTPDIP